jgi:transglutaminase-like putative cysteine protease
VLFDGVRLLVAFEVASLVAFVALAGWSVLDTRSSLPTIDVAKLATGTSEEQWLGIYIEKQHVGYAMSRQIPAGDGLIFQEQSFLKINAMGVVQKWASAGTALVDAQGRLQSFDFVVSGPFKVTGRGEVRERSLHLELVQDGEVKDIDIPIQEAPILNSTLGTVVRGRTLTPGMELTVPYFDITTMSNAPMNIRVEAPAVLPNGDVAWWLRTKVGSFESRRLVDERGNSLREESSLGMSTQAMSREEAMAVPDADPPDMVALASVPFEGPEPRGAGRLRLRVSGVEASRFVEEPGLQIVEGDLLTVTIPLLAELAPLPVRGEGEIEPTPTLPASDPEMRAKAAEIVGDAPDRMTAARRIHDFVFSYVKKVPTIGIPNGLTVLHSREGDCNEHTALYVSLARAAGIPSRIAVGLVYSERLGRAFYYHAWPEVRLGEPEGGPARWVPVDPTFGQFPADASHLKIVNGDLDKQVEVMGMMGRIKLQVVESQP